MSRSSQSAATASVVPDVAGSKYQLKSDLAQFCLPAANRDETRRLAYVNSLCLFILITGLIGIRRPDLITKEPEIPQQFVKVEVLEKQESEPPPTDTQPEEPPPEQSTPTDTPVTIVQVAAPDAKPAFAVAVDVKGPVQYVPGTFAPPPPRQLPPAAPSAPTRFTRNRTDGGYYPDPTYPRTALQQGQEGEAILWIRVDANGQITSVEIKRTSGHSALDRAALDTVRNRWRFAAGTERFYEWTCSFVLKK